MGNSIRRRRRAPRKRSVSFRSLHWLLIREATLNVLIRPYSDVTEAWWRKLIVQWTSTQCRRAVGAALEVAPYRRWSC